MSQNYNYRKQIRESRRFVREAGKLARQEFKRIHGPDTKIRCYNKEIERLRQRFMKKLLKKEKKKEQETEDVNRTE